MSISASYHEWVLNGLAPTASGRVYELHFPEEVHGAGPAGAGLFDLVAQAALPEVPHAEARSREEVPPKTTSSTSLCASASPRETSLLPRLRQTFETLHDGAHPLRLAPDKLSTLDPICIIEGKA